MVSSQVVKFGLIGVLNTSVDIALFHMLANVFGINYILANILSTGFALLMSFFLNAKYTFRSKLTRSNAALFVVTTIIGLWVLQPFIIMIVNPIIQASAGTVLNAEEILLLAKVSATVVSLVWNFILYKYVVFKDKSS